MNNETPLPIRLYEEYTERFNTYTDQDIIEAFNREAGNCGWGTARASYLGALHHQFNHRNFDYTAIGDQSSMSLKSKIKLEGLIIKIIDDKPDINPNNGLWNVTPDDDAPSGFRLDRLC